MLSSLLLDAMQGRVTIMLTSCSHLSSFGWTPGPQRSLFSSVSLDSHWKMGAEGTQPKTSPKNTVFSLQPRNKPDPKIANWRWFFSLLTNEHILIPWWLGKNEVEHFSYCSCRIESMLCSFGFLMIKLHRMKVEFLVQGHECLQLFIQTLTKAVSRSTVGQGNAGTCYLSCRVHGQISGAE